MPRFFAAAAVALLVGTGAACATDDVAAPDRIDGSFHSYILLDRTGSMSNLWDEALSSVNAYAASLEEEPGGGEAAITVAAFDAQDGLQFDVLRDGQAVHAWRDVTSDEASPRGMTPLFDAIGKIVSRAEADSPDKAVIVVMTDGEENASREMTKATAQAALDRAKKRGWEVVFLGADFANFDDADAVGISRSRTMAVSSDRLGDTMRSLAKKSKAYADDEAAEVGFTEEDRDAAGEDEVKKK